mmetsp:Transcript_103916/g.291007  ORF Transcript_103916/g.291007 Transcript_103916/m.291007 type:complete len:685 (-) Transcript_103916:97-2151(-)
MAVTACPTGAAADAERVPSVWRPSTCGLLEAGVINEALRCEPSLGEELGVESHNFVRRGASRQLSVVESLVASQAVPEFSTDSRESHAETYDIFLSHLQRNAQDAIIAMQMFLREARPGIHIFVDVDVDMKDGLQATIKNGVQGCGAFLFFITDGILGSVWCAQELRWAVEFGRNIVLVRETDPRHGGIEMKDFMKQVPEDLLHVFNNTVPIPWYREKGFRGVSVHTILKRARLEDSYGNELQKLHKAKRELEDIFRPCEHSTSCFDILSKRSVTLRVVVFLGGFAEFRSRWVQAVYYAAFNLCFLVCGVACCMNLFFREVPYHILPTDVITAYMHLPAWQSWIAWRRFSLSSGCKELVSKAQASGERRANLDVALRAGGALAMLLQLVAVAAVLTGFALPGVLEAARHPSRPLHEFAPVHAMLMWAAFPPVAAAMVTSYAMFGFTALLHLLDIFAMKDRLSRCVGPLAGYYDAPGAQAQFQMRPSWTEDSEEKEKAMMQNIQAWQRQSALEEDLFKTVADLLVALIADVQKRIDDTCKLVGNLWLHLVFLATCQVLAISSGFQLHATGDTGAEYRWWWACQDVFHLASGLILLVSAVGVFCAVTTSFRKVPAYAFELLGEARCPVARQASIVSLLGTRPLGVHILRGYVYVDAPKALSFFVVIGGILVDNLFVILGGLDRGAR